MTKVGGGARSNYPGPKLKPSACIYHPSSRKTSVKKAIPSAVVVVGGCCWKKRLAALDGAC